MRKDRLSRILSPSHGSRGRPDGPSSGIVSGGDAQVVLLGYQLYTVQVLAIHGAQMLLPQFGMAYV